MGRNHVIDQEGVVVETANFNEMNILVVGAGAIGSFYGGKLAQIGTAVSVVSRSDYEIVQKQGIRILSDDGDFHLQPKQVVRNAADYTEKADYIIVCLKVLPEIDVVELIRPAVSENTAIVLIQNGIEIEHKIAEAFPDNELISSIAYIAVSRIDKGLVRHQNFAKLEIGSFPEGVSKKTKLLCQLFEQAGVPAIPTEKIQRKRWQKLIWNAPFNPMSVLGGSANTADMIAFPEVEQLALNIMNEILQLAKATGNELPEELAAKNLDLTKKMKPYKTSMLLDYEADRALETEAILGNVIRIAQREKVDVPHLFTFYSLLKLLTRERSE